MAADRPGASAVAYPASASAKPGTIIEGAVEDVSRLSVNFRVDLQGRVG